MTTTRNTNESNAWTGTGILFGIGATALGVFSASRPLIGVAVYAEKTPRAVAPTPNRIPVPVHAFDSFVFRVVVMI